MEKSVDVLVVGNIFEDRPVLPDGIDAVNAVEVSGSPLELRFLAVTPRYRNHVYPRISISPRS